MDIGRLEMTDLCSGRRSINAIGIGLWAAAFLFAVGASWLIPPMQSPDEDSHIKRAYLISQGELLLKSMPPSPERVLEDEQSVQYNKRARDNGGRIGGAIDLELSDFITAHLTLAREASKRFSAEEEDLIAEKAWRGIRSFQSLPGTGYYFPLIYAPQAVGLAVGQWFDFSVQHSYDLAKALTLLACFGLLGSALSLFKPNPFVAAIVLLPMSLFQLLSPTIDGLTTSMAVLTVSLFMVSMDRSNKRTPVWSWGLAVCVFLLATSRTHLLPLLALPFYIAWQRKSRLDFYLGCFIAVAALGWVLFALQTTNDPRILRNHTTTQLLLQYSGDPAAFFKIVWLSLANEEILAFYNRSFIGVLGWLDTYLMENFYPTLWAGLAICALMSVSISSLHEDWDVRLLLIGLGIVCTGLVFLALLVTWTPHPATVIKGVQGRYFLVPLILMAYAISGYETQLRPLRKWINTLAVAVFALTSATALMIALWGRYH
jgi:uncharacterized membrane protein